MIKGTKSYRDQILQQWMSGCSYPQHRGLCLLFWPNVSVSEVFSFLTKTKTTATKLTKMTKLHAMPAAATVPCSKPRGLLSAPTPRGLVPACYLPCHNSTNPTEPVSFKFQLGPQWPVNESTERRKTHSVELCLVLLADLESEMLEALT